MNTIITSRPPPVQVSSFHRNGGYQSADSTTGSNTNTNTATSSSNSSNANHITKDVIHTDIISHHPSTKKEEDDKEQQQQEETRRIAQLSNTALENMAHTMMNESSQLSISLTQQLSTTTSGQHLLHTSTSLQVAIPSNTHALLQHNTPLLQVCEQYEQYLLQNKCTTIRQQIQSIQHTILRYQQIRMAIQVVQDLQSVEVTMEQWRNHPSSSSSSTLLLLHADHHSPTSPNNTNTIGSRNSKNDDTTDATNANDNGEVNTFDSMLDYANSLERTAMMVMSLTQALRYANETITSTPISSSSSTSTSTNTPDTTTNVAVLPHFLEYEQCIVKLSSRIRRVEKDMIRILQEQLEAILQQYTTTATTFTHHPPQLKLQQNTDPTTTENDVDRDAQNNDDIIGSSTTAHNEKMIVQLLVYGHLVRGLIVLGHKKDIEMIFTKMAIQPIYQKYMTLRSIDQGGTRGECHNLAQVMQTIYQQISTLYQPLLCFTERLFTIRPIPEATSNTSTMTSSGGSIDIDLVTTGIWVPLLHTLMTDTSLRMSIFSPGIASIVQTNYQTLVEDGLYHFAERILVTTPPSSSITTSASTKYNGNTPTTTSGKYSKYYNLQLQQLSKEQIQNIQERIFQHPMTAEFMKRWNLPIYYQLRFGECCTRINTMLEQTKIHGWSLTTTSSVQEDMESKYAMIRQSIGFELLLFLDLYDTIRTFWQPHIFIKPLTNRFLRGTIQILGRVLAFVKDGMDGTLLFGVDESTDAGNCSDDNDNTNSNKDSSDLSILTISPPPPVMTRKPYCWGESQTDVASVMWELSILESALQHDYATAVCDALLRMSSNDTELSRDNNEASHSETKELVNSIIKEATEQINPIIDHGWNDLIVNMITAKCAGPLAAVKGVAATYRMTNRPPPTMSSPFVITILRPLREFDTEFKNRIPTQIGTTWKQKIVSTISDRYAIAVDDLIATVQRAEESLLKRKGGRASAATSIRSGGVTMSDGEKVKLQLFLDYETYVRCVQEVGIDPFMIDGIVKLGVLTKEGETLRQVSSK